MCDKKCKSCYYSREVDVGAGKAKERLRACLYILATGKRRPCPAGKKCTVYRPQSDRRKWVHSGCLYRESETAKAVSDF